jgi:hypothetical protein
MLPVALHERPGIELVSERVPDWYGWSADTAKRGMKTLERHGLIEIRHERTARGFKATPGPTHLHTPYYMFAGDSYPIRKWISLSVVTGET